MLRRLADAAFLLLLTAWTGGFWIIGYLAVPALFAALADNRPLAGVLAGGLFERMGWLGLACGFLIAVQTALRLRAAAWRSVFFWGVLVALLLTAVAQFGIQPLMVQMKAAVAPLDVMASPLRDRFVAWHGVSSILYLLQSLIAAGLVIGSRKVLAARDSEFQS
jgi:hypothetical protein